MKTADKIAELRAAGYEVSVLHLRRPGKSIEGQRFRPDDLPLALEVRPVPGALETSRRWRQLGFHPDPIGGVTRVTIKESGMEATAVANANVDAGEHFNRKIGLAIAFGRANAAIRDGWPF